MKRSEADSDTSRKPGRRRKAMQQEVIGEDEIRRDSSRRFPIVGIGASAGGLEALEQFFKNTPVDSGMAFVVVQHLDPTHEGMLPELLQRHTEMPVRRIEDRMPVEPDHIYVIPPNRDLSILNGILFLLEQSVTRGPRLPIDFFFRSLADDWRERGVGVILSGMGTDGTVGLRAIKEQCGAAFIQDPATAKFDSMILSAIHEGLADVVAPVEELPAQIIDYFSHVPNAVHTNGDQDEDSSGFEKVLILLRRQTGHDFSVYKRSTILRRIERRMTLHHLGVIDDYVRYLRGNSQEVELLFKEMLIGVTNFFRDAKVSERLRDEVFPELFQAHPDGVTLRAWVAGCSTGEEAYSLAMVFHEALEAAKPVQRITLQIFATDLDKDAIDRARSGIYPESIVTDVSEERLGRFFTREERGFRVSKEIREMVVFARQNLVSDAPFTKLDILSCRNLLIYFFADMQKKLLPLFHYCLNPDGYLVLGNAETIGNATDLFTPLKGKERIFRRLETSAGLDRMHFPVAFKHPSGRLTPGQAGGSKIAQVPDIQSLASQYLLNHCSPVAVLASESGDILYINGRTGHYLEPAAGKANWNLFAMAREELNHGLFEVFQRAVRKKEAASARGLRFGSDDATRVVDITAHPIFEPPGLQGMVMVVFHESSATDELGIAGGGQGGSQDPKLIELARELRHSQEELQVLREEMQTTGEELKSSNEELQSANEELQSMNEELTTSKEEMQSMNEELQVVNQDLMNKLQDLSRTNNDMKNLLSSMDTATLFLDNELNVRWFAPQTSEIIHLIASDVGRPVTDIVSQLEYPALASDTREVLGTLVPLKKEIPARDGRWFAVKIIPYRTKESMIDGLVITFLDVSESRRLADELRACKMHLQEGGNERNDSC